MLFEPTISTARTGQTEVRQERIDSFCPVAARADLFRTAQGTHYDVVILGAGISGARIFHELARRGYRVLLLDRNDFAGGTSQASGMMVWGGLLYLKDLHLRTVVKLCRARDQLVSRMPEKVRAESLRYLVSREGQRNRHVVRAGMALYWLLGSHERHRPGCEHRPPDLEFLEAGRFGASFTFEEARLQDSDCRFTLEWILACAGQGRTALNHCLAHKTVFDAGARCWRLELRDQLHGSEATVTARFVVNAAGVWTDTLNERLGLESPYRHELSKGVYISFRRPESLRQILIFDTGENDDVSTFVPWGPVALCGPTETRVAEIDQHFQADPEDVRSLLGLANRNLHARYGAQDIVSIRCGIRPLAVRRGFTGTPHPLKLSRKHLIHQDRGRQALAVYGGKLTSCGLLAEQVAARLAPHLQPGPTLPTLRPPEMPSTEFFPGLIDPVPSAAWCRRHEHCLTLEDYLRRRTNIAQWVPRGGLGQRDENLAALHRLARLFAPNEISAGRALAAYRQNVRERHDQVLAAV